MERSSSLVEVVVDGCLFVGGWQLARGVWGRWFRVHVNSDDNNVLAVEKEEDDTEQAKAKDK